MPVILFPIVDDLTRTVLQSIHTQLPAYRLKAGMQLPSIGTKHLHDRDHAWKDTPAAESQK